MYGQSRIVTLSDFHATKLNNDRTIYIYLPPNYEAGTEQRYPALYIHDGQNVFDESTSSSGVSWGLHKKADDLIAKGKIPEILIVAIEFKDRTKEFCYYSWDKKHIEWNEYASFDYSIEGKGDEYADFIIHDLKPYIDHNFRTLPDKDNTALMGASGGGFITFNMGIRQPDIFGKLGIISPSFFAMDIDILQRLSKQSLKMWFDVGQKEPCLLEDTVFVVEQMLSKGYQEGDELIYYQVPNGFHSEADWGKRADCHLIYFFGDIGKPIGARLEGRTEIGMLEKDVRINPIVQYDSGITRSDIRATYQIENPDILEIKPDGTIIPKSDGSTRIEYILGQIRVSQTYTIRKNLSSTVAITFMVEVPEDTPADARIGVDTYSPMNLELKKESERLYKGTFHLDRGLDINYKIKMMNNFQLSIETDLELQEIPYRSLQVSEEKMVTCTVASWSRL